MSTFDNDEISTEGVDLQRSNPARVYDYWLGGSANFSIDRDKGDEISAVEPRIVTAARANRAFLRRAVRYLVDQGVRQFLDLGSGIPTVGNVHEVAHGTDPHARVAYVDNEAVAVAHSRRLLADSSLATVTKADLRDHDTVLDAPGVRDLLDFTQPVALLAVAVLQYFPDTEFLQRVLFEYRSRLVAGSYLVLSHPTADDTTMDFTAVADRTQDSRHQANLRDKETFARLLNGTNLVEPGIVYAHEWHNDPTNRSHESGNGVHVAVGRIDAAAQP